MLLRLNNHYFTPDSDRLLKDDFQGFRVELALDKQTILLVENTDRSQNPIVLMFDLISLDKIVEFTVELYEKPEEEEEEYRYVEVPEDSALENIPLVTSWNRGDYVLALVTVSEIVSFVY
jgi:hypothetical protein